MNEPKRQYRKHRERLLRAAKKYNIPRRLTHGRYEARLVDVLILPRGRPLSATWEIARDGVLVGKLHDGHAYGWKRPHYSISALRWRGQLPTGYPQNPEAALVFDGGPTDGPGEPYQRTLERFAAQADALLAWRESQCQTT